MHACKAKQEVTVECSRQILEEQPDNALDLLETSLLIKRAAPPVENGGTGAVRVHRPSGAHSAEVPTLCALSQ